ncbi:YhdP family protein [Gilvimarinus agarilyticus]|uniref:YhdP family protein n=1 Tax=Gilvimarinus agarilyticus TaxID=679259 RepID=UPI0005A0AD00|nr:YhdP family protein [Gilvimarinus agarilyticus]
MLRALGYLLRKLCLILAVLVIALAVLIQAGRSFSYLVADYRQELEALLSEQTQGQVKLAQVSADWSGLQPVLEVTGLEVDTATGERLLAMDRARLRLDIIGSVLAWRPVWGNVELAGGAMALRQDDQGHWRLQGVSNDGVRPSGNLHDKILDILLASRRIAFKETHLDFYFTSGEQVRLESPSLLLENSGDFHRLLLQLDVAEQAGALFFLMEGRGDPRDKRFSADAYLQLRNFPANNVIAAALKKAGLAPEQLSPAGSISASLWFGRKAANASVSVVGDVELADVTAGLPDTPTSLTRVRADVSGQFASLDRWHVALQQSLWVLDDDTHLEFDFVAGRAGPAEPVSARASRLDLAKVTRVLQRGQLLTPYPALTKLVDSLDARGKLEALELTAVPGSWADWTLSAALDTVSVGSWNQVPAFERVSGFVTAGVKGGYVQLDSRDGFSMAFPGVYERALMFDSARGRVAWHLRPEDNRIFVNSGPLDVTDGAEQAQGYFHLEIPWQRNSGPIDLTVYVAAQQMAAGQYKKYLPAVVPEDVTEYLTRGIGDSNPGVAEQAAFIYRGAINSRAPADHSVSLKLDIDKGYFNYHPDWPAARNLQGRLLLDNADLYTSLKRGQIYNSDVQNATITLRDNPVDDGKVLGVNGRLDGIASDGLRILRQSVLRDYVGDNMDTWYLHGDLIAAVDLAIPLSAGAAGSYHDVQIDIDASSFALDNYDLELADFSGRIFYNSDDGLSSENLQGQLFGRDATITLDTEYEGPQTRTVIDVAAEASVKQLAEWRSQPALLFAEGQVPFDVHVALDHRSRAGADAAEPNEFLADGAAAEDELIAAVGVTADLTHTSVSLPRPLNKATGVAGELVVNYILGKQTALADVHYLDELRATLHIDPEAQSLLGGAIALGGEPELLPQPALHVSGQIDTIDVSAWQEVLARLETYQREMPGASGAVTANLADERTPLSSLNVPLAADLRIAEQSLGALDLKALRLQLRQLPDAWDFVVTSDRLTGELNWPLDSQAPAVLAITQLQLPPVAKSEPEASAAELSPDSAVTLTPETLQRLRRAEVTIEQLQLGEAHYGRWQFNLEPFSNTLVLTDLEGEVRGLSVKGREGGGGTLRWQLAPEVTELEVAVSAHDMADVMDQWQAPQSIESESAEYQLALSWPGGPAAFELAKLEGDVAVDIGSGRFVRDSAIAGEGLLRLMGLFNFDSLARRLRLDFSDLYKSGLTFDAITGSVRFESGQMAVVEPVLLRSPSSRMQLTGTVNLLDQTLDTRLVATLPMGGNLTVIAALAAGLPAAAGVFVISKLFEEQMNKVTSLTYRISGGWDNPVTAFDRASEVE